MKYLHLIFGSILIYLIINLVLIRHDYSDKIDDYRLEKPVKVLIIDKLVGESYKNSGKTLSFQLQIFI